MRKSYDSISKKYISSKSKVLFGENAPGLYTNTGKGVVDKLKEIGEKYGYAFSLLKTNTFFHGIPQKRERKNENDVLSILCFFFNFFE